MTPSTEARCCDECWRIDPFKKVQAHCENAKCPCHQPIEEKVWSHEVKSGGLVITRDMTEEYKPTGYDNFMVPVPNTESWENANPEQKRAMALKAAHEANAAQREVMGLENWEEEFDRVFVTENLWKSDDEFTANVPIDNIKSFISSLLTTREQRAFERGKEAAVNYLQNHKHCEEAIKGLWYVGDDKFEAARALKDRGV